MRKQLVGAMLLALGVAVPAQAAEGPSGQPCLYTVADAGTGRTGVLAAGPYTATGTVTCSLQVGAPEHAAKDSVSVSAKGDGVVVLAPTIVNAEDIQVADTYLCTAFDWYEHGTLYWSGGGWTSDPYAPCDRATSLPRAAVVPPIPLSGWIRITTDVSSPPSNSTVSFTTGGYLANANLWTCDLDDWWSPGPEVPYHVTCVANTSLGLEWSCSQLDARARAFPYAWLRVDKTIGWADETAAGLRQAVDTAVAGGSPTIDPGPPPVFDPVIWGEVVTTAECSDGVNGWSSVTTGVANQAQSIQNASAAVNVVPATIVRCWAKDSYGRHAQPNYHATCWFG